MSPSTCRYFRYASSLSWSESAHARVVNGESFFEVEERETLCCCRSSGWIFTAKRADAGRCLLDTCFDKRSDVGS